LTRSAFDLLYAGFLIQNKPCHHAFCQFVSTISKTAHTGDRLMTGKIALTGGLVVWLVYVAWMASYYFGTFTLFAH